MDHAATDVLRSQSKPTVSWPDARVQLPGYLDSSHIRWRLTMSPASQMLLFPINRQSKSPCTAELSDRAVCPFAASNGMCKNLDWAAFQVVVKDCTAKIAAGEMVITVSAKGKRVCRNKKPSAQTLSKQLYFLRRIIGRVVAIDFVLHNLQNSPGLRCSCGFVFGSAVSAALHVSAGCTGEPLTSLDFLASVPPITAWKLGRGLSAELLTPSDSGGTFTKVIANGNEEDDGHDVSANEKPEDTRVRAFHHQSILCIREHNLEVQSIVDAVPSGKLVFSLDRHSGDHIPKNQAQTWKKYAETHNRAFQLSCTMVRLEQDELRSMIHPLPPTMPEYIEMQKAFMQRFVRQEDGTVDNEVVR